MAWESAQQRLVAHLRRQGIQDEAVLAAIGRVPRELFVAPDYRHLAYDDEALPIAAGQSISQPIVVATMTQALKVRPGLRVLEIGTGSGYQAAVLAEVGTQVVSLERLAALATQAGELLQHLGYDLVQVHEGDGTRGWLAGAPYDRVIVTAAAPQIPPALVEQLAAAGRLVAPVGSLREQELVVLVKQASGELHRAQLGSVRFVPLVGAEGWSEEQAQRGRPRPSPTDDGVWRPRRRG